MRVLILGGDGYLGWPTAMRFSGKGHEVAVADNFARRKWVTEAGGDSLTPIVSLAERIEAWKEASGKQIESYVGNILSKLGFSSRAQIAAWAVERGLLNSAE